MPAVKGKGCGGARPGGGRPATVAPEMRRVKLTLSVERWLEERVAANRDEARMALIERFGPAPGPSD